MNARHGATGSVQQHDRLAADLVQRLSPLDDLPDRRQLGVGRALPVDRRRRARFAQARLRGRKPGRRRRDRLPVARDLRGCLRRRSARRSRRPASRSRTARSRHRCLRRRPTSSRRSHRRCRPRSRPSASPGPPTSSRSPGPASPRRPKATPAPFAAAPGPWPRSASPARDLEASSRPAPQSSTRWRSRASRSPASAGSASGASPLRARSETRCLPTRHPTSRCRRRSAPLA